MPVKDFFRKIQPVQLYVVLTLTVLFFIVELIVSHLTHALTLLMDSYHMLCHIMALVGCITTIKVSHTGGILIYSYTVWSSGKLCKTNNQCHDIRPTINYFLLLIEINISLRDIGQASDRYYMVCQVQNRLISSKQKKKMKCYL